MSEFNQSKYINKFIKDNYDTIKVQLPKGQKDELTVIVDECETSMNNYMKMLIEEDIKRSDEERIKRLKAYVEKINEAKKKEKQDK